MEKQTFLVLIRHGETMWNRSGRYQGHADSPLTSRGQAQARATAEALAKERFDAFYSSDLGRASQTAQAIADRIGKRFLKDSRLREQHYGILQGHDTSTARSLDQGFFQSLDDGDVDYTPTGGESRSQHHQRALAALEDLARRHTGNRILIVSHGGIVASLLRETLGIPLKAPRSYSLYNLAINRFTFQDGRWELLSWGDVGHLAAAGTSDAGDSFTAA